MVDRLQKIVESCGAHRVVARSGCVGSVLARGADGRGRGHTGERDLRPTRGWLTEPIRSAGGTGARGHARPPSCGRAGLDRLGRLTGSFGWLTGPSDGTMGP
jgi:hypothetical protein